MGFKFNPFTVNLDKVSNLSGYVPYTGATADLDLGTKKLKLESGAVTGLMKHTTSTGAISYIQDNSTNWDAAYNASVSNEITLTRIISVDEDNFIDITQQDYSEIDPPRSLVWQNYLDQNQIYPTTFTVKFPYGESYTVGIDTIVFQKSSNNVVWGDCPITEGARWLNPAMDNNEDPNSVDEVWAFRCNEAYNPSYYYRILVTQKMSMMKIEGLRPFEGDISAPLYDSVISDNIYLPKLESPYVWEMWRWVVNKGATDDGVGKKSRLVGAWTIWKEGFRRFKIMCRGEIGEHSLQEITSRLTDGYLVVMRQTSSKYKTQPFKFAIYNTITGARTRLCDSPSFALKGTGPGGATRGLREISK